MPFLPLAELKRRLRKLKQSETVIRFGGNPPPDASYVWDRFFDLHPSETGKARYSLSGLCIMTREEYKSVVEAFFYGVYYQYYKENGFPSVSIYDPERLENFGLPPDAGIAEIRKRFHQLALLYHPDTGGDAGKFIEMMEQYQKLMDHFSYE